MNRRMNDFVDTHEADPELLYDFIDYLKNKGSANNGT